MQLRMPRTKTSLSSAMLALFFFLLIAGTLSSVFFQAPLVSHHEINRLRGLFNHAQLSNLRELTLTNRLGTFTFQRTVDQKSWRMVSPRSVMANSQPLERILEALEQIKIKSIYDNDPINISNYSLDNPQMRVKLVHQDLSEQELLFGLLNPIDNSSYIKFDQGQVIYHVDALNFTLENLDLINFIDSRIFTFNTQDILSLRIWRDNNRTSPSLHITHEEGGWRDSASRLLEPSAVQTYLQELTTLRSVFIIDKKSPELQTAIDQQFEKPFYHVEIINKEGIVYTYQISQLVQSLPEIKFERRQNFLIQASNRDYPFMLHKDALELFNKRNNQFAALTIKKLFY